MEQQLRNRINRLLDQSLYKHSRIHKSNGYFGRDGVYFKRDDELSSGIIGTKWRKYTSLLPALKRLNRPVMVTGSFHSNNVLGLVQLLIEQNVEFEVCVKSANNPSLGNGLWLQQLVAHRLRVIPSAEWQAYEKSLPELFPNHTILPEGASNEDSVAGLLSLPLEIVEWEQRNTLFFDQVFIDSGSGLTAACLIEGFKLLSPTPRQLTITHVAGDESEMNPMQSMVQNWLTAQGLSPGKSQGITVKHIKPITAKSFGSTNATLVSEWQQFMASEGIMPDLVYSMKHFYTTKVQLHHNVHTNPCLIIYTGGSFAARNHESKLQD